MSKQLRSAPIHRWTSSLALTGATLAAGLLVTGCGGTISSAVKSAVPSVTLPTARRADPGGRGQPRVDGRQQ